MGDVGADDFELIKYKNEIGKRQFKDIEKTSKNDKRLYLTLERDEYQQIFAEMEI